MGWLVFTVLPLAAGPFHDRWSLAYNGPRYCRVPHQCGDGVLDRFGDRPRAFLIPWPASKHPAGYVRGSKRVGPGIKENWKTSGGC